MYGFPLLFAKKYKLYICTEANKPYLYNTEINYRITCHLKSLLMCEKLQPENYAV